LTQVIEKYPQQYCTQKKMQNPDNPAVPRQTPTLLSHFVVQAAGTQYFVVVFGHAFAAEIAPTLRAAGDCFPQHMIAASLMKQVFH
jgi:hypothetical protein